MSKQFIDQLDQEIAGILANPKGTRSPADPSIAPLADVAFDLLQLPNPDFKARLKANLERKALMTTTATVLREGFRTVTPYLRFKDESVVEFVKTVFNAKETLRTKAGGGGGHLEVQVGDSMMMFGIGAPVEWPTALRVYVEDADEVYQRALDAGAKSLLPISERYGKRSGAVQDIGGNQWYIATSLGPSYIPSDSHTITNSLHPHGAANFIDFLKTAFEAQVVERYDSPQGEVDHARIRIGDSIVEVGEGKEWWGPMPATLFLYVPDADAWYDRALRAPGVKGVHPMLDLPYGRSGGIEDPFGNQWFVTTPPDFVRR